MKRVSSYNESPERPWPRSFAILLFAAVTVPVQHALPQSADFQIVWITIGEVAAPGERGTVRAGRQLFMAPDLVQFSLDKVTVAQVDVQPSVTELGVGDRFCFTSLDVRAVDEDGAAVKDATLSVSVRQDQRERLGMKRLKNDICVSPTTPGEYPLRFNSLIPARDGTTRGAQIFMRVRGENPNIPGGSAPPEPTQSADHERQALKTRAMQALDYGGPIL